MENLNKNKGGISIVGLLILGFIVLLVLSYFKISLRTVVESPTAQDNIHYVGGGARSIWDDYLAKPARYLWHDVWVEIFWKGFISNMERIRDGKPTDYQTNVPTLGDQGVEKK